MQYAIFQHAQFMDIIKLKSLKQGKAGAVSAEYEISSSILFTELKWRIFSTAGLPGVWANWAHESTISVDVKYPLLYMQYDLEIQASVLGCRVPIVYYIKDFMTRPKSAAGQKAMDAIKFKPMIVSADMGPFAWLWLASNPLTKEQQDSIKNDSQERPNKGPATCFPQDAYCDDHGCTDKKCKVGSLDHRKTGFSNRHPIPQNEQESKKILRDKIKELQKVISIQENALKLKLNDESYYSLTLHLSDLQMDRSLAKTTIRMLNESVAGFKAKITRLEKDVKEAHSKKFHKLHKEINRLDIVGRGKDKELSDLSKAFEFIGKENSDMASTVKTSREEMLKLRCRLDVAENKLKEIHDHARLD